MPALPPRREDEMRGCGSPSRKEEKQQKALSQKAVILRRDIQPTDLSGHWLGLRMS